MHSWRVIYKYTFRYKFLAFITIAGNLLFTVFNLLSLVLFIPFLQLIFKSKEFQQPIPEPRYSGHIADLTSYVADWYNFTMHEMVSNDPKQALLFVCISVFIAFFLKNTSRYLAIWFQSELRMAVVRDVRDELFSKAMNLPLSFHSQERKGDLMARMNSDVGEIENGVVGMLELIFREPISIIIHVASLLYISPSLTLVSLFLLPVTAFIISRIGKSLKRTAKNGQEQLGLLYSAMDESLGGIRIIKAFNAVDYMERLFRSINLRHQQLVTRTFRKRDVAPLLSETLGAAVMMCLVWFGGSIILDAKAGDEALTGELFVTFIIIFSQLLRPIQSVSNQIAVLQKARVSMDRINEVLTSDLRVLEPENPLTPTNFTHSISYNNVSFRYGDELVLKNVSFTIPKGKTVALVGESGSGKSTIADLLPRFYDPEEGNITIDSIPIQSFRTYDLRQFIGIVSQESILFNTSVLENIAFGDSFPDINRAIQAAQTANAHSFISQLELGYNSIIGERGNKLSGGQKQRLCIARALYKNPEILILDEATSALDTESEKLVQEALDNLMRDRTSLVIAHRLSTIKNADEIIVLSNGEITERGTHQELLELQGSYYRLCSLQGMM
ncbi:MAG: ABC transporter ATP-binding protein/permease [Crocinitomicaceae bacterium]|nr:ABC transporter ATP-binding protein/permease [Crocinitomicaceae bacterium]MCF8410074.1 ABC transporter ATP-binding protein/permease [Crocinitomicaceae bacterium]